MIIFVTYFSFHHVVWYRVSSKLWYVTTDAISVFKQWNGLRRKHGNVCIARKKWKYEWIWKSKIRYDQKTYIYDVTHINITMYWKLLFATSHLTFRYRQFGWFVFWWKYGCKQWWITKWHNRHIKHICQFQCL